MQNNPLSIKKIFKPIDLHLRLYAREYAFLRNALFPVSFKEPRTFLAKIYSGANKQVGAGHRDLFAARYEDPGEQFVATNWSLNFYARACEGRETLPRTILSRSLHEPHPLIIVPATKPEGIFLLRDSQAPVAHPAIAKTSS